MTASTTETAIPGYVAGTWTIDPVHSEIGFSVRHMMVSKVRGKFTNFSGEIVTGDNPFKSSVTAVIDLTSISTGQDQRDAHLRSADFFEVETYPTMTYRSTGVRFDDGNYILDGELTLKGAPSACRWSWSSTASGRTPTAAPGPGSPPAARSTGATSTSTSAPPCRTAGSS